MLSARAATADSRRVCALVREFSGGRGRRTRPTDKSDAANRWMRTPATAVLAEALGAPCALATQAAAASIPPPISSHGGRWPTGSLRARRPHATAAASPTRATASAPSPAMHGASTTQMGWCTPGWLGWAVLHPYGLANQLRRE